MRLSVSEGSGAVVAVEMEWKAVKKRKSRKDGENVAFFSRLSRFSVKSKTHALLAEPREFESHLRLRCCSRGSQRAIQGPGRAPRGRRRLRRGPGGRVRTLPPLRPRSQPRREQRRLGLGARRSGLARPPRVLRLLTMVQQKRYGLLAVGCRRFLRVE